MTSKANPPDFSLRSERGFAALFSLCSAFVLSHFVHGNTGPMDMLKAPETPVTLYAPQAYRILIPAIWTDMQRWLHLSTATEFPALTDFVCCLATLYLLYLLIVDAAPEQRPGSAKRLLRIAIFFAFSWFSLIWVTPWMRPETMPSALYLAAALHCVSRLPRSNTWLAALAVITFVQSFARTDIPTLFGITIALLALTSATLESLGSRKKMFSVGSMVAAIGAGVQLYLQKVKFPHLTYDPQTPVVMWHYNFMGHFLMICFTAMLPFLLLAIFLLVRRQRLQSLEAIIVLLSLIYFPLWFTVGSIGEVRIYVPCMLTLGVVAASVLPNYLVTEQEPA